MGLLRLIDKTLDSIKQIDRIVGNRQICVVHSNTLAVLAGALWAFRRNVPHLWHVHEIIRTPKLVSKAFPWLVKVLADRVVSNSRPTEEWLLREQPRLAERSEVVFNGLPPQAPSGAADPGSFRRQLSLSDDAVLVVLAGRINSWKGQSLLIAAVDHLRRTGKVGGLHVAIVGDTPPGQPHWLDQLKKQVADCGLTNTISFVNFVDDIRPVWAAADIAVVPSTEPEPFGMVAIEAMAAGVPVVAAAHGGLLDIVADGETGILFEPKSVPALAAALAKLLASEELRNKMGNAGLRVQKKMFSVESQVESLERIYSSLAG